LYDFKANTVHLRSLAHSLQIFWL